VKANYGKDEFVPKRLLDSLLIQLGIFGLERTKALPALVGESVQPSFV
jgi:hypothetical protein